MAKVHIVLDSTANVPQAVLEEHENLHVVPLTVILGSRQWREDEIRNEDLFSLIEDTKTFPTTSQPALGDFIALFQPIIDQGGEIVVITLSSGLSGTMQGAQAAAQSISPQRIRVVDSGTTAIGMVRLAEAALVMADGGKSAEQIAAQLEKRARAIHTLFVPSTLEHLRKGGRIGGAAALIGTILQIRPVLYLHHGEVAVLDKVRTWQRALIRIVEEVKQHNNPIYLGIVHINAQEDADRLYYQLQVAFPTASISISTGGAVLAAHLGSGLVGIILEDSP